MNSDRFHNSFALELGRKRIVEDKRFCINITYQEAEDPWISICVLEHPIEIGFSASMADRLDWQQQLSDKQKSMVFELGLMDAIANIAKAASVAYWECRNSRF